MANPILICAALSCSLTFNMETPDMSQNRMEQGGGQWSIDGQLAFGDQAEVNALPLASFSKNAEANPIGPHALSREALGNLVQGRRNLATTVAAHYVIDTLAQDWNRISPIGVGQAVYIRGAAASEGGWTLDQDDPAGGLYVFAGVPNTLIRIDQYQPVPGLTVTELTTGIQWAALTDGVNLTWVSNVYDHVVRLLPWDFREEDDLSSSGVLGSPDGASLGVDVLPDTARLVGSAPGAAQFVESASIALPVPGSYIPGEPIKLAAIGWLTGPMEVGGSLRLELTRYSPFSVTPDLLADETHPISTSEVGIEYSINAPNLQPGDLLHLVLSLTADNTGGLASPDRAVASNITLKFSALR
ncbi:MAG: hypothetical protein PsegKO_32930 [Pseudohongiellaceae bacterium]